MDTQILDGKSLAEKLLHEVQEKRNSLRFSPRLLIIQVGDNPASTLFVSLKKKKGEQIGIDVEVINLAEATETELLNTIKKTISDHASVTEGIMIQLPLPKYMDTEQVLALIPHDLDVDGLLLENSKFPTAVADAVLHILENYEPTAQYHYVLILGNAPYVGGSIYHLLRQRNFTHLESVNEYTPDIPTKLKNADIVISCIGKPHIYSANDLKQGAILIDVGTSKDTAGNIVGDFDTSSAEGYLRGYTPVPGGVGPLTVAMLLKHVVANASSRG